MALTQTGCRLNGDLNISFDRMARILPDIERKSLNVGGKYLVDEIKKKFVQKLPAAARPIRNQTIFKKGKPVYQISKGDSLVDAVRQTAYKNHRIKVHILGSNEKGSGQFLARFFEAGTKPRRHQFRKGKKLKKGFTIKRIGPYVFFETTINTYIKRAQDLMGQVYNNQIERIFNS